MNELKNYNIYVTGVLIAVTINICSWNLPFFWDTILTSTITQYFYLNGFQGFITPAQFDAGHPPLFYTYVTLLYQFLGKNLLVAHLSMLPFTILSIFSFVRLMSIFSFTKQQQWLGVLLFFAIPAVVTQYTLISYDAVLLSLYLAALVAYFDNRRIIFMVVVIGIAGISLRGLVNMAALSVTIFFMEKKIFSSWLRWNLLMLPAIILLIIWLFYHYQQTGWLLSTNAEGWAQQRSLVETKGLLKNVYSLLRVFTDFGMVLLSMLSLFYGITLKKINRYSALWFIPAVLFALSFLPFTNPINHRYFLIVFVLMLFPVIQFLSDRKIIYTGLTVCILILGHFLIYPEPVSNGWDCTLVHVQYSLNRKAFVEKIDKQYHLNRATIGTVFPMNTSLYQTDMTNDSIRMYNVNGKDIHSVEYLVYSNVCNDFSDEQINELKRWQPLTKNQFGMIDFILYKKPKNDIK